MGNCSTENQHIGQPTKIAKQQNNSNATKRFYRKTSQFVINIPPEQPIITPLYQEGLLSRTVNPITNCKSYQQYRQCLKKSALFIDKEFRHQKKFVCHDGDNMGEFQWKRIIQLSKGQSILCSMDPQIETTNFKIGKMYNPYLISAFATLAQKPQILWQIVTQVLNNQVDYCHLGIYAVWLFIDGKWRCIIIDDYFPSAFNTYLFSRYEKQFWAPIIQKAYAKYFKAFYNIENNFIGNFLTSLTGAPSQYLVRNKYKISSEQIWKVVRDAEIKGHLIAISSESCDVSFHQLQSMYSYPVIETQQIYVLTQTDKKLQKILKLANPWGKYEWKGRWSEYSDVWSEQLRTQLGYQKADQSVLWISIDDLLKNFGQICINRFDSNYINNSAQITLKENEIRGIFLKVPNNCLGYLNVYQRDEHHFHKAYKYSVIRLILLKINTQTKKFQKIVKQLIDNTYCASTDIKLQHGLYYILFQTDWKCAYTRQLTINTYTDQPVNLTLDPTQINNQSVFNQLIKLYQQSNNAEIDVYTYGHDPDIKRIRGQFGGYVFYHYKNNSKQNTTINEHIDLKNCKNLQLCDAADNQLSLQVRPGQQMMIKMKISEDGSGEYELCPEFDSKFLQNYSSEELLQKLRKNPNKIKRRQVDGKPVDVYIRTVEYSGGLSLLYENKMNKFSFVEEIQVQMSNLEYIDGNFDEQNKINIQLAPNTQRIISFKAQQTDKPFSFKTKVSYYITTPQFQF